MSLTGSTELDALLPEATQLVGAIHEYEPEQVHSILARHTTPDELRALVVLLAGMVPDDQTPGELLGWVANPPEYTRLRSEGVSAYAAGALAGREEAAA
ncbi:hypothetical protein SAMN04487905_10657 [Actinopolyspora xinjiangensis]|uniref:Uncharacterized protein n=1 Tax=Actinopolyspora xinjiangensis TaxID=405564 RepID=A0A1H0U559_9ACTN|nr:hypothetical protein [Actinopolyspora xinjiangensis]SDP61314.1 hypothetical protein SAMN04487905_10657 [Actinopolyspora xinjiangensis]